MDTLFLTAAERKAFDALPQKIREWWKVEGETVTFRDSDEGRLMRYGLARFHDPRLQSFIQQVLAQKSVSGAAALFQKTDLAGVMDEDIAELFFVLGPSGASVLVSCMLQAVKSDTDLEGVAALTVIRHSLLLSLPRS